MSVCSSMPVSTKPEAQRYWGISYFMYFINIVIGGGGEILGWPQSACRPRLSFSGLVAAELKGGRQCLTTKADRPSRYSIVHLRG